MSSMQSLTRCSFSERTVRPCRARFGPIVATPHNDNVNDAQPLELADAYSELHNLILDGPDVTDFLRQLAALAAAIVPGTHCGVTLRRDNQVASVASSDEVALRMDELQYIGGFGPCLEALQTGVRVDVPDMSAETRWGGYASYALANGIQSSFSLPLSMDGETRGAINLFSARVRGFSESDVERTQAFADQAATSLTLLLRQADTAWLDQQLREALATRAVIDQALGILMGARKITSREAFEHLRQASQSTNRRLSDIATDVITTMTGHPPEPARPLTHRD